MRDNRYNFLEYEIVTTLENDLFLGSRIQNKNNLDILNIQGDSMLPFLSNGDKVVVERECKAKNGDVVIAIVGDELYVKRIQTHPFGKWVKLKKKIFSYKF